jgi:hypothetical protein
MIEAGDAASAGPLARRAVERVTAALMYMDDSAGIVGDDLRALMVLYARACREAPPDAKRLATWLVSRQLDGPGWPAIELKEFAEALGPHGLAKVARLTEERGVTADPDSWTAQWGDQGSPGAAGRGVRRHRSPRRGAGRGSAWRASVRRDREGAARRRAGRRRRAVGAQGAGRGGQRHRRQTSFIAKLDKALVRR